MDKNAAILHCAVHGFFEAWPKVPPYTTTPWLGLRRINHTLPPPDGWEWAVRGQQWVLKQGKFIINHMDVNSPTELGLRKIRIKAYDVNLDGETYHVKRKNGPDYVMMRTDEYLKLVRKEGSK